MSNHISSVAGQLDGWFQSVLRLSDEGVFSIAPEGPHRRAVILDVARRNARILLNIGAEGSGEIYSPLCFFLAAACRLLGISLGTGHWCAALENVSGLRHKLQLSRAESHGLGLDTGSPSMLFKQEFDEAVCQASLVGGTGRLSEGDRHVALGLAINWGMRLLLAKALEVPPAPREPQVRDLAWVSELVASLA